ncbi:hypothetical protein M5K25_015164 [Dendrobium thyrsiflorum]|uniref:Uncharacterized protein n=1 Tax=Dendrobium thyrsiflorum TaxID=117978 RepID=A0ABD0UPU6_DENTH
MSSLSWWSSRMSGLSWWSGRTSGLRWWSGRTSGLKWWSGDTPVSGGGPTVVRQNSGAHSRISSSHFPVAFDVEEVAAFIFAILSQPSSLQSQPSSSQPSSSRIPSYQSHSTNVLKVIKVSFIKLNV